MTNVIRFLVLPKEISEFERRYLARVNRVALIFFAMHIPVFMLVAWLNHTRPFVALALTSAVVLGPAIARWSLTSPRSVSIVHGISAMFMGGLLVHFGQGPMQIEMHFYFFALVAMCAVFGNPLVIVAAAVTVALHHLLVFLVLPHSVFNYDASWWVVTVHAAFVVLESVAACYISRSFFDNVIGLEKIVQARTAALDAKNRDMRMLLDNVQQGFLTIDRAGTIAPERSAAIDGWFGVPTPASTWFDYLATVSPALAVQTKLAWDEVIEDTMPIELTLEQMPHRCTLGGKSYNVDYRPIGEEPHDHYLVIVTDITSDLEREHAERERGEAIAVFERVLADRSGFETFFEEGSNIVDTLTKVTENTLERDLVSRLLHTLKGNAAIYGLESVVTMCHKLEDYIADEGRVPARAMYHALAERWMRLASDIEKILGSGSHAIQIDETQYRELLSAVTNGAPTSVVLRHVRNLRLESTKQRLGHFGEQAQRIARRLDKGDLEIRIEDNDVRLDPKKWAGFWSSFIHAVRNALDHGIELPNDRAAAHKPEHGALSLTTHQGDTGLVIEISDDGRGVDWSAVAERAQRLGLPTGTKQDVERALFTDGVSTASNVTDLSGRGVGMGALMHATRSLGGELSVESIAGRGTCLRMTFPTPQVTLP